MSVSDISQYCKYCELWLEEDKFYKYRKLCCKSCIKIRIKCVHGRRKSQCKECGNGYCEHGRWKSQCKECGKGYCEHGRRKNQCKDCGTGKCVHGRWKNQCKECGDEIKITFQSMIIHSKSTDKKYDIYNEVDFIDYEFLEELKEKYTHCYWNDCKVELQYIEYRGDLCTIERINNNFGHIKSNCVFACLKCNNEKKSNR